MQSFWLDLIMCSRADQYEEAFEWHSVVEKDFNVTSLHSV
jgi:hypothetical protein